MQNEIEANLVFFREIGWPCELLEPFPVPDPRVAWRIPVVVQEQMSTENEGCVDKPEAEPLKPIAFAKPESRIVYASSRCVRRDVSITRYLDVVDLQNVYTNQKEVSL